MKKIAILLIVLCLVITGCSTKSDISNSLDTGKTPTQKEENNGKLEGHEDVFSGNLKLDESLPNFSGLEDPKLASFIESDIYASMEEGFADNGIVIENVKSIYLSDEYVEELEYNSKQNVFFGYTLSELDSLFEGKRYVFTLGNEGTTIVQEFKGHDDTYVKMLKNVAVGTGVILVCVTVTYATGGAAAGTALKTVNVYFAAAAKGAEVLAGAGTGIGALTGAIIEAMKDGANFDDVIKSAGLGATNGFKWGAIIGAAAGASVEGFSQYAKAVQEAKKIETMLTDPKIPDWRKAELRALLQYSGKEQVAYLAGEVVPKNTYGATKPDIVRNVNGVLEAIEVKYYNLASPQSVETLLRELKREVTARVLNLPIGSLQRIVLDVTGKGFSSDLVNGVVKLITENLMDIYPNIPITVVGL